MPGGHYHYCLSGAGCVCLWPGEGCTVWWSVTSVSSVVQLHLGLLWSPVQLTGQVRVLKFSGGQSTLPNAFVFTCHRARVS